MSDNTENTENSTRKRMGVQKGTKRGSYKRSTEKRKQKEINEDGLSYQEIAAILGITSNEVKQIEQRALKKLRIPGGINRGLFVYDKIGHTPTERIDI